MNIFIVTESPSDTFEVVLAAGTVGAVFDGESPPHAAAANMTEAPKKTTINERKRSRQKQILVTSDVTEHPALLITAGP
ncbi:MAG: hypothetical protein ABIQ47_17925 [Tepidiformaceae bacterium]